MANYYDIDERMARVAHDMNSMFDYVEGSTTARYRREVDRAATRAAEQIEKKPEYREEIEDMLDRYSHKLADWYNATSRVDAMCPSIMIAGGDGLSASKKEKQNMRRDVLARRLEGIREILHHMDSIGTGGIKADDEKAVYKLQQKLEAARELQEHMKAVNGYFRKNRTLKDCDFLTQAQAEQLMAKMTRSWHADPKPFESFEITNNGANIRRIEQRIKELQKVKETGSSEIEPDGVKGLRIVENAETMRIQLMFDGKPELQVRNVLKANGFRWAPSQSAWQRQLNDNGKRAAERVLEQLREV